MLKVLSGPSTAIALAVTVAAGAAVSTGTAHAAPRGSCGTAAVFKTEIQWGGDTAPWHADADLRVMLKNRHTVLDKSSAAAGTTLNWSGANGAGAITFAAANTFTGTAQFPGEGPVGYRGTLTRSGRAACDPVAVVTSQIQWGGDTAPWHADADLVALVKNRHTVVDRRTAATGTKVSWAGPNGKADITFDAANAFTGTAQFPDEGPVGYRSAR